MKPHARVDCEEVNHPGWRAVPLVGLVLIQGALAGTSGGAERIRGSAQSSTPLQAQLEARVRRLPGVEVTDVQFNRISRSQGLSQTRVTYIVQDARGFMWCGTQYGLDRSRCCSSVSMRRLMSWIRSSCARRASITVASKRPSARANSEGIAFSPQCLPRGRSIPYS